MIDCPPNLHLASWASLVASDALIVPLQPEDFGAQGIADVQESIDRVVAGPNPGLKLLGFLITMSNNRLAVHKGFEQLLRTLYGAAVFTTTIPISTDFKESIVQRKPVALYKPRGAAAKVMKALAEEIAARLAGGTRDTGDARRRPPDMGKLDDLLKSGGANIAESMGAGLERGDKSASDLDHAGPLAGSGQEQERHRGPAGQDRPRPGPAARGIRAGGPRAARRLAQDPGPAPADPGALGRGPGQVRPHLRGTPLACGQDRGDGHHVLRRLRGTPRRGRASRPPARRELPARGLAAHRAGQGVQGPDGQERLVREPGRQGARHRPADGRPGPGTPGIARAGAGPGGAGDARARDRLRDRQGRRSRDPARDRRPRGLGAPEPLRDDRGRPLRGQGTPAKAGQGQGGEPAQEGPDLPDAQGGRL